MRGQIEILSQKQLLKSTLIRFWSLNTSAGATRCYLKFNADTIKKRGVKNDQI